MATDRLSFGAIAGMSTDWMNRPGGLANSNCLAALSWISRELQSLSNDRSATHVTDSVPVTFELTTAFESTNDSGGSLKQSDLFVALRVPLNVQVTRPNLSDDEGFLSVYYASTGCMM